MNEKKLKEKLNKKYGYSFRSEQSIVLTLAISMGCLLFIYGIIFMM